MNGYPSDRSWLYFNRLPMNRLRIKGLHIRDREQIACEPRSQKDVPLNERLWEGWTCMNWPSTDCPRAECSWTDCLWMHLPWTQPMNGLNRVPMNRLPVNGLPIYGFHQIHPNPWNLQNPCSPWPWISWTPWHQQASAWTQADRNVHFPQFLINSWFYYINGPGTNLSK